MDVHKLLEDKKCGRDHSEREIEELISGIVDGSVTRAQAAAWLAFVCVNGMKDCETVALTRAMTESGSMLTWPGIEGPFIDKHSTGGVGDKISLILAPVWVALGFKVPMISGRGLGITGGTLDKLEAVPGYRTDLDQGQLRGVLQEAGCFISGQTGELCPADAFLYGLRDETSTVASIPLITASILSKKLAEGLDRLVLDVKAGSGAFMKNRTRARKLADSLVRVGRGAGLDTSAHITDMSQPLGVAVGNALEVQESIDILQGRGPKSVIDLVCLLSGDDEGARAVLSTGRAYEVFERMVHAQGGDLAAGLRGSGCTVEVVHAGRSGTVTRCDALGVGQAAFVLGAGRVRAADPVHHGVGLEVHAHKGDTVTEGQPLVTLHHADKGLREALEAVRGAITIE
ncbi:MAG: thymidine phosphorylase [Proteobacteria bacterium]|nr:thymidine phosphorylase [Pseudomonadota bacterium]MCP4921609.1 thymidine phosphorylase [Pseudomonadota bacterium]